MSQSENVPGVTPSAGVALSADRVLPTDPAELEAQIELTRARLVGTVDELSDRLKPKALARQSAADAKAKVNAAVRTPDGSLRVERIGAVAAAVAAVAALIVWNRRRLSRKDRSRR